jgi:hypothetical protein
MKVISLEYAQSLIGDPQAIARKYLSEQTIVDAQELAKDAIAMPTFGQLGYLSAIGYPHQWWVENSSVYRRLEQESNYQSGARLSCLLLLAEYFAHEKRVTVVESRLEGLKLSGKTNLKEYRVLSNWLTQNQCKFEAYTIK